MRSRIQCCAIAVVMFFCVFDCAGESSWADRGQASQILASAGITGGLVVHVGCGSGQVTVGLAQDGERLVQGLDSNAKEIEQAREYIRSLGLSGRVSIDHWDGRRLPYIDNLVNLIVVEDERQVVADELMRVLCPNGVAVIKKGDEWFIRRKPRPDQIDDWTHYLYDASNNAVSHDSVVGPPARMQWLGSPRWSRHHDRMSSVSAVVSAGGRVFYILDEASRASILVPAKWSLIARDAFNGTILWTRSIKNWHTHLWPLKSGPAQLPRRLVADADRVYVTLSLDGPLVALDAATGETVRTYPLTKATEEVIQSNGILFALVDEEAGVPDYANLKRINNAYRDRFWDERPREVVAVQASTGNVLWSAEHRVLPATLAANGHGVFFHDGQSVVCLDRRTGQPRWRSDPVARADVIRSFYLPILVLYEDVVLFSGGETAGAQTGSWYTEGKDTMTALSANDGDFLWTAYHPPSGYRSPEDLLVADGLVWTGETTSGRAVGVFTGRDPKTGDVKKEFPPDVDMYWFHHRCYRGKATDKYLLMSRTGTEFIDLQKQTWTPHHWVRGACSYGVMPANGLLYAPQHPCACYLEAKLYGFNALAPASGQRRVPITDELRLETGPAYDRRIDGADDQDGWPTYRHDAARSGMTADVVPPKLVPAWKASLGGKLTAPVIAAGKVFVASVDEHILYALDAKTGQPRWRFNTGGRIDSPPTIVAGRVFFGSADGWVYCLAASEGSLAWRFRAAPTNDRLVAFEQVESVWPVPGNALVRDSVVYCVAGRSMFLDGGLRLLRLDASTGRKLSETLLDERDTTSNSGLQSYVSWLNMPVALPDILSSDGRYVYMRSQPFRLDGTRLPLAAMPAGEDADRGAPPATQDVRLAHLFCPTGFLDDSWWHRTYWLYGSRFVSGWCGYFLAGKEAPAGRLLVFDDTTVYGFGRKPQYYRWTTPIEHQLFAAAKASSTAKPSAQTTGPSVIRVAKSKSLNPAGKALTVEAWVLADKPDGVIVAHGGGAQGYVLHLTGGRPHFAVRSNGTLSSIAARNRITGTWAHLVGVLGENGQLQLYVNGELTAVAREADPITADPAEAMQIAADEGSAVGEYAGPQAFKGLIDEVRIYHRAISTSEAFRQYSTARHGVPAGKNLALWYSFDDGRATDQSGHDNDGEAAGVIVAQGRIGRAMAFAGRGDEPLDFSVEHRWTRDLPLFARAMVLAGQTLFVAGPPDLVDEPQAFKTIDDREAQVALTEQAAALSGQRGGVLLGVLATDGEPATRLDLDSPPVFDGMAAAYGRLYISGTDGQIVCLSGDQ